jgi:hypothetical protein
MLRARKRRAYDWGLRYFFTALLLLVPVAGLGLGLALPWKETTLLLAQLENVYGLLALLGVVTLAILGMLYKIVPFLVWYASYSKAIGRFKVPAVADMYSARWQAAGFWPYLTGLGALAVAAAIESETTVRVGAALLLLSLAAYAVNLGKILRHLWRPSLEPLSALRSPAPAIAPAAMPPATLRTPLSLTLEKTA